MITIILIHLGILLFLLPVVWIIGMIHPKLFLRWSKNPTRLKITGWWVLSESLCFFAICACMTFGHYNFPNQGLKPKMDKSTGKWGYVERGKAVIPFLYDEADYFSFTDGLAKVKLNGKYGFIDKTGKEVVPPIYDEIGFFLDDLAKVKLNGKMGFVDQTGKEVVPPIYEETGYFLEGLEKVASNGKYGFIDKKGHVIIPISYDYIGNFKNGLATVKLNEKYGFINTEGETVVPAKYDEADDFVNGFANVRLAESMGRVDTSGLFTVQSMKISLLEAVKKKYVRFSAHGSSISSSYMNIKNETDMKLHLIIPAGTFLNANSSSYQNMVLTNPKDVVIDAGKTYSGSVNTACMNIHRDIPGSNSTFGIAQRADNHLLSKVIKLLNEANYNYSVKQAAIWIITDGATYSDMGILQDQYRRRIIDFDDYQKAVSIVNEARKMKLQ